ncbi:MAG: molybdopterin-synthase adenylyltransferase [Clostridiales bacterium]|jgi:molybdopterin/thiamine biosynthesis adenylyltransferase|nr:molybdopterin-synthase adenylyltransferase [Clostridiales bacterium]MDN5297702.1 molybdopterin-synthase adenylyltransferase [Clostridiales bacterium]
MNRYDRNREMISAAEQAILKTKRICVIGCGGLGGYVVEMLARIGIGHLTVIDGDCFDVSNLNRQLLAEEANIGIRKVDAAKMRIEAVNREVSVHTEAVFLDAANAQSLIKGHDLVVDALDRIPARMALAEACAACQIPMVHGAIGGWFGQVAVVLPGDDTLQKLYANTASQGIEVRLGNPSFTPAIIAGIQVSEAIKCILGKGVLLRHRVLYVDLLNHSYDLLMLH